MLWLLLAVPALAETPVEAPITWSVDGAHSTVYAKIDLEASDLARSTGYLNHVVRLGLVDGSVTTAGSQVTAASVTGVVASLKPADGVLRKLASLTGVQSESQAGLLMDCVFNQLQPEVDNTVSFTADRAEGPLDALKVHGTFHLHGVDKPVVVPVALTPDGDGMKATGSVDVHLPDYGFRIPESGWTVKETATVVLDLALTR